MKTFFTIVILILISLSSCGQRQKNKQTMESSIHKFTNHLINESSPYLLQHAHNPVNWHPWGEEALEKATRENKLIIVSIGYSACHWCHVMEHESFENEEIAQYMNDHFVAIKVDREERPDIDQVYMNAVQLLTGRGGWPLNCITLPDGRPIYGGTYFPPAQWLDMLKQVSEFVKLHPKETEEQAAKLTQGIRSDETIYRSTEVSDYSLNDLKAIFEAWEVRIDYKNGGHAGAPKFPLPVGYQYLLFHNHLTQDQQSLEAVTTTLQKMADGGIYDQIGGGFARYSTDAHWKVPHFEKMLYDNAQLLSLYASAYQKTKDPSYKRIVEETIQFIEREMTSKEGGFYSALDADSEGIEGKYYVWENSELESLLGNDADLIKEYYNTTIKGNWENGVNILLKTSSDQKIAKKYGISESELMQHIAKAKNVLLKEREKRIRPGLDDKILTSWNALMIKGYIDSYRVFDKKPYLKAALKNAEFLKENMIFDGHRLNRNYKDGKSTINGFLDDYAFTISAFIAIYQSTFEEQWLTEAKNLARYAIAHFFDDESGMFYYTSDLDPQLIARKMEINDNVIPSANSEMAKNLYLLGTYFYYDEYIQMSKIMLDNVKKNALAHGAYYANWDILMAWFASEPFEVAIVGSDFEKIRKEIDKHYLPNVFLLGGNDEGKLVLLKNKSIVGETMIYVCKDKQCQLPVKEVSEALKQIL